MGLKTFNLAEAITTAAGMVTGAVLLIIMAVAFLVALGLLAHVVMQLIAFGWSII